MQARSGDPMIHPPELRDPMIYTCARTLSQVDTYTDMTLVITKTLKIKPPNNCPIIFRGSWRDTLPWVSSPFSFGAHREAAHSVDTSLSLWQQAFTYKLVADIKCISTVPTWRL